MGKLQKVLEQSVRRYGRDIGALDVEYYRKKKVVAWIIKTSLLRIEILFLEKGGVLHVPGTLYARIYPRKNGELYFLPHELAAMSNTPDLRAGIYGYIGTEERMTACFDALTEIIGLYIPAAEQLAQDAALYAVAQTTKQQEVMRIYGIKPADIPVQEEERAAYWANVYGMMETMGILPRFAAPDSPYERILVGEYAKACKLYAKMQKNDTLTAFERLLYAFIQTPEAKAFEWMPPDCNAARELQPHANSRAEGLRMLIQCAFCMAAFGSVFSAFFALMNAILSAGTTFFAGVPWYLGYLAGGLCGLFGGLALRRPLAKLLYPRKAARILAADRLINGKGTTRFAYIVFFVSLIGSLLFVMCVPFMNVAVYEDRISYTDGTLHTDTYPLDQLYAVYYMEGRYNDYDEYIDRPSYVLQFTDGRLLDMDSSTTVEQTEQGLLPLLHPYVKSVQTVHSDRDIAQVKGE